MGEPDFKDLKLMFLLLILQENVDGLNRSILGQLYARKHGRDNERDLDKEVYRATMYGYLAFLPDRETLCLTVKGVKLIEELRDEYGFRPEF